MHLLPLYPYHSNPLVRGQPDFHIIFMDFCYPDGVSSCQFVVIVLSVPFFSLPSPLCMQWRGILPYHCCAPLHGMAHWGCGALIHHL